MAKQRFKLEMEIEAETWPELLAIFEIEARQIRDQGPNYAVAGGGPRDHRKVAAWAPDLPLAQGAD